MSDPEWKQFERLVARIEELAAPRGAVVRSPDKIPDRITGQQREVDASIRFRVGTVDILVTVECRRRERTEDVRWIEELVAKRADIGAAKTIAVSSSGYSQSAKDKAQHFGIELRTLSEVVDVNIGDWFLPPGGLMSVWREIEDVKCTVLCSDEQLLDLTAETPLFFHNLVGSPFPAVVFLQFLEMTQAARFWSVPLDGTKTRLEFDLDATASDLIPVPLSQAPKRESGILRIHSADNGRVVTRIRISALVSYEATACAIKDGQHHVYQSGDGATIQHGAFETEMLGLPARI